jgi:hypothetical protein
MDPVILLFLVGGFALTCLGVWMWLKTRQMLARSVSAEGRYIDAAWQMAGNQGGVTQYGLIEFQTHQGETILFRGRVGTPFEGRKVGRPVRVRYDPARPTNAVVDSFVEIWTPVLITLAVGVGWIIFAIVALLIQSLTR